MTLLEQLAFPIKACFLALPLEGQAKYEFQALQQEFLSWEDSLSFQNPQSPHLTLQYWSELMEIEFHQVMMQSEKIASAAQSFNLKIEGVETFGHRGEDRVLFLSVPFSEELARLKKRCPWPSREATGHGLPEKPFHPHITIARVKHPQRFAVHKKKILKVLGTPSFALTVDRLRLYGEVQGKKQTPLAEFPLGDGKPLVLLG